jgi:hypothetical protein
MVRLAVEAGSTVFGRTSEVNQNFQAKLEDGRPAGLTKDCHESRRSTKAGSMAA